MNALAINLIRGCLIKIPEIDQPSLYLCTIWVCGNYVEVQICCGPGEFVLLDPVLRPDGVAGVCSALSLYASLNTAN